MLNDLTRSPKEDRKQRICPTDLWDDIVSSAEDFELLATLQVKSRRTPDAIATITRGLQATPYSPSLYRDLAQLYLSRGDREKALRTMKDNLALFPEDHFTRVLLERTLAATP